MKGIYEIRKENVLQIVEHIKRKELAKMINMDVGLLNQYLRTKNPKNFGQDVITRITNALNLPNGYLDHVYEEGVFQFILQSNEASEFDAKKRNSIKNPNPILKNQFRILKVLMGLIINKENKLEITQHLTEASSVHYPDNMSNPLAFLIIGNTNRIPYKDGWVIICEQDSDPIQGEEALIFLKNNEVYAGEILHIKENFIEYESTSGQRDSIKRNEINRILPIKIYVTPSQKIKSDY